MSDIKSRPCVWTLPSLMARVSRSCVISAAILSTSSSNMLMLSTSLAESCRETARCSRLARRSSSAARLTSPDCCSCAVHRHPDQLTTWYSISSRGGCNTASQLLNKVRGLEPAMLGSTNFILRPHLLKSIVHVIRFITNRKYTLSIVYNRSDCHLTIYP